MNECKECGKQTKNAVFCSRSCSARFNNRGTRRHGRETINCLLCGVETRNRKFCSNQCQQKHQVEQSLLKIKITGDCPNTKCTSKTTRRFLEETFGKKCSICELTEWRGKFLVFDVDHIDGNSRNNKIENLRLLCPNCHSQTETYKAKNKKSGRSWRNMLGSPRG